MASRILDMGDILTLIEQAQKEFDAKQAQESAHKLAEGSFGLDDFLAELQQVRKMGPMKDLLAMVPGMARYRSQIDNFDEHVVDQSEAIIKSMTPAERRDPTIIDGSRRARIAAGSGTQVSDVNGLIQRFEQAAKMMKRLANGSRSMAGLGMPGMGMSVGGRRRKGKGRKNRKKRRSGLSGNPAKRAEQEAELRERLSGKRSGSGSGEQTGASFHQQAQSPDLSKLNGMLPPGGLGGLLG